MNETPLPEIYLGYIACLNRQDWSTLGHFVVDDLHYNEQRIGIAAYRKMLMRHAEEIPDLYFEIHTLVYNCTPTRMFLGLHVDGKRLSFSENVFYRFRGEKIEQIWSVIDKAAIEV
jgi:predicted ester cyclase